MPDLNGKNNNRIKTVFNIIMARYAILMIVILMIFVFFFAYKFIISPISASINGEIKAMNADKKMQKKAIKRFKYLSFNEINIKTEFYPVWC